MVTYAYWALVILLTAGVLAGIGLKLGKWPIAMAVGSVILLIGRARPRHHDLPYL